ncbi:MAG TPA: radical SAM protein [Kiritimatiellia bacterium]|nr:radical SAM protein [Kiritimatiellia bacterium]HRZ12443.1 radical SAM protein [Kiritimatiellia bacterium]HSA17799.1 radical SAM protein [Kiritimatiellia bacterium]
MRVLFLYPVPPARWQRLRYQQGIGSICAVLKQAGHEVELLVLSEPDRDRIAEAVRRFNPGLAAISLTSAEFDVACAMGGILGREHRLPVILGGIHPTLRPEESIAADGVFAICIGEGEYPILELCEALERGADPAGIRNLWVRRNGTIHRNELRPLLSRLDDLPFPDRKVFRFDDLVRDFPEAEFMGSRGCPYPCAYCANHSLLQLYRGHGPYVRYRSVDRLLDEMDAVVRHYPGIEWLGFHDDTFTMSRRWLSEFCEKYPARFQLPFWCNSTATLLNEDTVACLKKAGCYEVRVGVESGNDRLRMDVLRKKVRREDIVRAFRLLREAGIQGYSFNMIGLPHETPGTIRDTIRLNQEIRPSTTFCSVFYPFPGTQAHDVCRANGWLTGRRVASYFENDYAVNQPTVTRKQVLFYHAIFGDLVRWPRLAPLITLAHRVPVWPGKSLWNAIRRVRAKVVEWGRHLAGCFRPCPVGAEVDHA